MNGATPQREKVTFSPNVPQVLRLDYDDGQISAGRFGDQYQYTFDQGSRIAWLDPEVRELILASGARAGDEIGICKRIVNRKARWEVSKVEEEPREPFGPTAREERAAEQARRTAPAPAAPRAERQPPGPKQPAFTDAARTDFTVRTARLFADCINAAVHAARLTEDENRDAQLHWGQDDIRAMATTMYINAAQGGKR